jgi:hypothetical protein
MYFRRLYMFPYLVTGQNSLSNTGNKMEEKLLLGIDIGTTGAKAALFSIAGNLQARGQVLE